MLHLTDISIPHQDELREIARRLERKEPDAATQQSIAMSIAVNDPIDYDRFGLTEYEASLVVDAIRRLVG